MKFLDIAMKTFFGLFAIAVAWTLLFPTDESMRLLRAVFPAP